MHKLVFKNNNINNRKYYDYKPMNNILGIDIVILIFKLSQCKQGYLCNVSVFVRRASNINFKKKSGCQSIKI